MQAACKKEKAPGSRTHSLSGCDVTVLMSPLFYSPNTFVMYFSFVIAGARCAKAATGLVKIQVLPFTPTLLPIRTFSLLSKLCCIAHVRAMETNQLTDI